MRLRLFRRQHHDDLDARVADAQARAEDAAAEARKSQVRQEAVRENVVRPLRQAAARNQFAEMLRDSLIEGRERRA